MYAHPQANCYHRRVKRHQFRSPNTNTSSVSQAINAVIDTTVITNELQRNSNNTHYSQQFQNIRQESYNNQTNVINDNDMIYVSTFFIGISFDNGATNIEVTPYMKVSFK